VNRTVLLEPDAPEWRDALDHAPHDFHHEPGYAVLCAAHESANPRALFVESGGRRMLLPLLLRDGIDAASPYGYPGPVGDPEFMADALRAGMEFLRAEGIVSVFIRLHPILNAKPPEGVGTLVEHGSTVAIDLSLTQDEQWSQTRADHRNQINRALRRGHRARVDADWVHFDAFQRMYAETMQRVGASPYYRFDRSYFEGLRDGLGDRIHLCVVEIEGAVAGGGLFVETAGLMDYHLSATDESRIRERPTKLMLHFMRGWAAERGNRLMHLGGGLGGNEDSLFEFKAGFSPLRHVYRTLRLVTDERRYAELVHDRDPAAAADDRSGFFPAYRRPR